MRINRPKRQNDLHNNVVGLGPGIVARTGDEVHADISEGHLASSESNVDGAVSLASGRLVVIEGVIQTDTGGSRAIRNELVDSHLLQLQNQLR